MNTQLKKTLNPLIYSRMLFYLNPFESGNMIIPIVLCEKEI